MFVEFERFLWFLNIQDVQYRSFSAGAAKYALPSSGRICCAFEMRNILFFKLVYCPTSY